MNPGRMRHRVTLQSETITRDSFGQETRSWTDEGTFWALVRPAAGRERPVGQQLRADVTHRVTMRWLGSVAITPQKRLLYRGRTLNIVEVLDVDERRRELDLGCIELVTP